MGIFRDKIINQRHTHNHNTTVIEKRAATDESIRLLKEFEEKAESKFVDRINIKNNLFEYTLLEFAKSVEHAGYAFMYYCTINGKEYKGKVEVPLYVDRHQIPNYVMKEAHTEIAEKLVATIVTESMHSAMAKSNGPSLTSVGVF